MGTAVLQGDAATADVACAVWDATRLPLRACSVDAFVSDFPFGRRHGSSKDNQVLHLVALAGAYPSGCCLPIKQRYPSRWVALFDHDGVAMTAS